MAITLDNVVRENAGRQSQQPGQPEGGFPVSQPTFFQRYKPLIIGAVVVGAIALGYYFYTKNSKGTGKMIVPGPAPIINPPVNAAPPIAS